MALKYLLDTNIVSEPVRRYPNKMVISQIEVKTGEMAIAATTWHELLFGVFRMPKSNQRLILEEYIFDTILNQMPILGYEANSASWFAKERARLSKIGRPPSYPDGQIAAIAATNDLTVVTRNVSDFIDFDSLKIENWFEDRK